MRFVALGIPFSDTSTGTNWSLVSVFVRSTVTPPQQSPLLSRVQPEPREHWAPSPVQQIGTPTALITQQPTDMPVHKADLVLGQTLCLHLDSWGNPHACCGSSHSYPNTQVAAMSVNGNHELFPSSRFSLLGSHFQDTWFESSLKQKAKSGVAFVFPDLLPGRSEGAPLCNCAFRYLWAGLQWVLLYLLSNTDVIRTWCGGGLERWTSRW